MREVLASLLLFTFSHLFGVNTLSSYSGVHEVADGTYAYIGPRTVDRKRRETFREVTVLSFNGAYPAGARILITRAGHAVVNADGVNNAGLPYFDLDTRVGNSPLQTIKVRINRRSTKSRIGIGYEVINPANGSVSIAGNATVTQTLRALVSDEDGLSEPITHQWFADGTALPGANGATFQLTAQEVGRTISVSASYTDDSGFVEEVTSDTIGPVAPRPDNIPGVLGVSGDYVVGSRLMAEVNDANGLNPSEVTYQWRADGLELPGATLPTLDVTALHIGRELSVEASYTDDFAYQEEPGSGALVVVSQVVNGATELANAVATGSDGDWIGLADGDYANMPELSLTSAVTLTLAQGSSAVIRGATCIHLAANKSALVGLTFDEMDLIVGSVCDANGDSSVYVDADNVEVRENSFLGEVAVPSSSTYNWIALKDSYALLARNVFANKNSNLPGAAISVFNNASNADQYSHLIEYNLFRDFVGGGASTAYAIQVGRSTQVSANDEGSHTVRYNRFENVQTRQRLIRVQSSRNYLYNNTIEDSTGHIGLENGERNTVANNIILPTGEDDATDDSGILFTPYGHVVSNNYIAGLRTTSSLRGALYADSERAQDPSSLALEVKPVTLSKNTVINSRQPIHLSARDCVPGTFVIQFEGNLIANGHDLTPDAETEAGVDYGFEGRAANGEGRDAVIDDCDLNAASTANQEHYYSRDFSKSGGFVFPAGEGNIGGDALQGGASLVPGNFGLFEGAGFDQGSGADTSALVYLTADDVGPGSTYAAPAQPVIYEEPIQFDLRTWNITFPDGSQEDDPQWLLDGNTRDNEFFYTDAGAMVFRSNNVTAETTANSNFPRSELREMLRGPEPDPRPSDFPPTQGFNRNNWVFSSSSESIQALMGGVDGTMNACLSVNAVSTDGNTSEVGRTIVGQIHASDDEPARLYYRKLPQNELGSIYVNHEVPGSGDITFNLIGDRSENAPNPIDGVALDEVWCYQIKAEGQTLTVTIERDGKPDVQQVIQMDEAYIDDWMYFRAGNYNQNNSGPESFAQVTFFFLEKSHAEPPEVVIGGGDPGEEVAGIAEGDVTALVASLANAAQGDIVAVPEGNYADVELELSTDGVSILPMDGGRVVFSGRTCLYVPADDVSLRGLEFRNIAQVDSSICQSRGNASVVLEGDRLTFAQNLLDTDAVNPIAEGQTTYNWVSVRGSDIQIQRNTFRNKRGVNFDGSAQAQGSFISVFITGSGTNNTIQYNLFEDMLLGEQSGSHAIQLGRTTGLDATESGLNTIQFNRFNNIDSRTRVIRVLGSNNLIDSNTVVDSQGMIALEHGQNNTVSNNVILPNGLDSNDGGISFAPYGHTVSNNYIAGSRTSSGERAGLYFNYNATGDGNNSLIPETVTLSANTVVNARQAILFGGNGCGSTSFPVLAENNLVANGVSGVAAFEGATQNDRTAVRDDCTLNPAEALFANNHVYSADQSTSGSFDLADFGPGNITGSEAGAELVDDGGGWVIGQGRDLGIGADTRGLLLIEAGDVGIGSTTQF